MKVRYSFQDSETGESDVMDFEVDILSLDQEGAGQTITKAFSCALGRLTGEEEVDIKFESFVVASNYAVLTFREKCWVSAGDRARSTPHHYDILVTGIIYTHFK